MSGRPITTRTRAAIATAVLEGERDQHIADRFGIVRSSVERIRNERGIPANYGRGRPSKEEARS
ncbi:helix-turn-helix domain-containing protein [Curtobacterium flaccumfaciens]|uniref:helix-turn-helix domain-containing protein n=1 Tax=Curtobacterium flaccumfaciens TaxID=2035 RepID=UPI002659791E|nr:helix-turn-helix domain-containing protein [Curtobacterium flaccumfaciens]MCS5507140.1 helix-turn-helix domain-containing protein [Curtobacterium flaccumfaciens pv. flaccumfaciens]